MEELKTVTENLVKLIEAFKENAEKSVAGNKAAGARARKVSVTIGKILPLYRKVSVSANKK